MNRSSANTCRQTDGTLRPSGRFRTGRLCVYTLLACLWAGTVAAEENGISDEELRTSQFKDRFEELLEIGPMIRSERFSERMQLLWLEFREDPEREKAMLLALVDHYRSKGQKAATLAVLQELARRHVEAAERQEWYFELAQLHREMGAYETAIARYYQVLNPSVVRFGADPDDYRERSQKAQFEIARTYFEMGDHERATELFSRLELLELSPADRETVAYYLLRSRYLQGDYARYVPRSRTFLNNYPDSTRSAEVIYMQARSLEANGNRDQALRTTLDLLRRSRSGSDAPVSDEWEQWQKRAGNFFANHFFERGDLNSALQIYQSMAQLSDAPEWLWPIVYQIGICTERLGITPRAREAYEWIVNEAAETEFASDSVHLKMDMIVEGAQWRLSRLERLAAIDERIEEINPNDELPF